ncbi:Uncharacterised protein [Burkholderia pseudomallei]|nr:Uncharacterised protein [Burkholderia pseudomallei]
MPEMIVWPDSSSVCTRNDGSSCARRFSARPIFSWSAFVFGSTACEITGSGNTMRSSTIGCAGSHSVSPVVASFRPTAAAMSPARTSLISSRWFACICRIRPRRSFLPLVEFSSVSPEFTTPEYTRKKINWPTNGSVMILNASDENFSSSEAWRSAASPLSSSPLTGGMSTGDGRKSITASSMRCTPLFLNAVPHSIGWISHAIVRSRSALTMSASGRSPSSRYLFIRSSLASAAASTIFSRHSWQVSASSAGMST